MLYSFFWDDFPAYEFHVPTLRNTMFHLDRRRKHPMKMEKTVCSEMSVHKIQTKGNHPKQRIQRSEVDEILKIRTLKI